MAQRAYRQRKESTLDELRRRVTELSTAMECMNKTFEDCRDRLISAGLPQAQVKDLVEVSTSFTELMKTASNPGDTEVLPTIASPTAEAPRRPVVRRETAAAAATDARNVSGWIDHSTLDCVTRDAQDPDIGLGYTMYMPNASDLEQLVDDFNAPSVAQAMVPSAPPDLIAARSHTTTETLYPTAIKFAHELPLPKTYSFEETTLGRRLHRACIESAYHLLVDPSRRPHTYERAFRLSLLSRDRQKLAAAMKQVLDRGACDDLDFWEAPLIHVGGAGTHYPRRDQRGNVKVRRPLVNVGLVGPHMLALLEGVAQYDNSPEMMVEIAGFEGEWFDPYDVEGYLAEKGVHIDASASFAEAELIETLAESSNESSGASSVSRPQTTQAKAFATWNERDELRQAELDMARWDELAEVERAGLGAVGYTDVDTGSWLNFLDNSQPAKPHDGLPTPRWEDDAFVLGTDIFHLSTTAPNKAAPTRTVIIDVAKFIKGESQGLSFQA